ncbi:MAG: sodium:proton antiporter, partial [Bacteroidales bacterium]|nr:sodium:proton antiporter [Bacteroidales bacterium]
MSKTPSPIVSFVPIITMVAMLYVAVSSFGSDALSGPSQVVLLVASALTVAIGMAVYKIEWARFENAIVDNIKGIASATIILLIIGALSGAWMLSGVVPTLIDYGIALINPRFFLATACIICILVSVMTGSSWTTIATIGIALMGIGQAQGYSDGWIAGAIISGAYFGDKISPLSDTTVLAASVSHTPLFDHIRYMLFTTIPSIVITLVIFVVAGITGDVAESSQIDRISAVLNARFNITPWLLIVPIVTGVLIARRVPTLITLFASTVMAVIAAVIAQPDILASLGHGDRPVFEGAMKMLTTETSISSGNALVDDLISTRGMAGMLNTVWLILCAMCFGGTMTASGMLRSITAMFARMMKSTFSLVSSTVCSGLFLNLTTADQYISIILTGNMFRNIYEREGYESR